MPDRGRQTSQRDIEFTAFFHTHFAAVRGRLRWLGHSPADADDICAGVFAVALRRFDELRVLPEAQARG